MLCRLQSMQQKSDFNTLLLYQSKVDQLTEEINQLQTAKSRLEWITVGSKSYQTLKRYCIQHADCLHY